jgi:hypothetical protein
MDANFVHELKSKIPLALNFLTPASMVKSAFETPEAKVILDSPEKIKFLIGEIKKDYSILEIEKLLKKAGLWEKLKKYI